MNQESRDKQKGQVIIILLLLMLVGLSIGLALTQRSITDVATSTQSEQSSRAFSAAEAGIEKALSGTIPAGATIELDNNSTVQVSGSSALPVSGPPYGAGIEYPPIGRETTAQFWFTDPYQPGSPAGSYAGSKFDIYYGNDGTTDLPAIEVRIIMFSGGNYYTKTYYYDSNPARTQGANDNNFTPTTNCGGGQTMPSGILGDGHKFFCKQRVPDDSGGDIPNLGGSGNCASLTCVLVLARVRFLYVNENHSLALAPVGPPADTQFPPQVILRNATGTSGQSQKQIQAFTIKDVVPPWFDYAIFSVNKIQK